MSTIDQVKQLREETGLSLNEIRKALDEAKGDTVKAKELLRNFSKASAEKKSEKEATQGIIDYYIHPNLRVGVLLDIRCQTDFVAKSEDFKHLAHEICLQIAALNPLFVKDSDIPAEFLDGETKIYQEQMEGSGKPENIVKQVIEGKLQKYKASVSLLSQLWVKDDSKTMQNLVEETISKTGENIEIKQFARYEI